MRWQLIRRWLILEIIQVLSIQAEQVNGKSETLETSQKFTNTMPEIELLNDIIPINKKVKVC